MTLTNKPTNWLLINELQDYVSAVRGRHWSRAYIYTLMNSQKLKYSKYGSARVVLKEDVDQLIDTFKRPAPPKFAANPEPQEPKKEGEGEEYDRAG